MPYPWLTMMPVRSVRRRASSGASGAAPDLIQRTLWFFGKMPGLGGLAQGVDGGRDHRHHGDAFLNQKSAQLLHVEARHQNQRGAERQRKSQRHGESVDVVERQEAEHDVVRREHRGIRAENLINIRDQVVVREHDALGQSGGAAGVGKRGDGLGGILRRLAGIVADVGAASWRNLRSLRVTSWRARGEDAAQRGQSRQVHVFEKRSVGDEKNGVRSFPVDNGSRARGKRD